MIYENTSAVVCRIVGYFENRLTYFKKRSVIG